METSLTEKAPSHVYFCVFLFRNVTLSKLSKYIYKTEKLHVRVLDSVRKLQNEGFIEVTVVYEGKRMKKVIKPNLKKLVDVFNEYAELGLTEEEKEIFLKNLEKTNPWIFVAPYKEENISEFLINTSNFIEYFTLWHKGISKALLSIGKIEKEEDMKKIKENVNLLNLLDKIIEKTQQPITIKEAFIYISQLPYSIIKKLENAKLRGGETNAIYITLLGITLIIPELLNRLLTLDNNLKNNLMDYK